MKAYYTNQQLDELSKEYRTMPVDGEGRSYEPEYNSMAVRGDIIKLVSDVKLARRQLYAAENVLAIIANNYSHVLSYKVTQEVVSILRAGSENPKPVEDQPKRIVTPENCTHKDEHGEWTVVIDGDLEQCTQCGLAGK